MNVKAGQKVIQIKSVAGNTGSLHTVIEFLGIEPTFDNAIWYEDSDGPCWLCESFSQLPTLNGPATTIAPIPDAWLRPVSDIPDEEYEIEQSKLLENV